MNNEYTITVFSENHVGLLNQITIVFTRRHINIESLTVSASALPGIHKFTIVVETSLDKVEKVVKQIEKRIDVLKAYYLTNDEVVHQEIAMYKVPTNELLEGNDIEHIVRKYSARILEVTKDYTIIHKTGHKEETQALFHELNKYGVLQFVRSGRIAITKGRIEKLSTFLKNVDKNNKE